MADPILGCPACGADASHVTTKLIRDVEFSLPPWEGKRGHYDETVDTCGVCTESGDFRRVNDAAITRARELAVKEGRP